MAEKEIDQPTGVETTGHEWDGIKELNNPLPRWWVIVFYISIIWSVIYWVFMPSWPGINGYLKGVRNHTERANVEASMAELAAARSDQMSRLLAVDNLGEIENDPELLQYTLKAGESIFGDNCATCHGAGGQGFKGYPALVDDAWLWGGSLEDIQQTIRYGIRSGHPDARLNTMQAFGRDGILSSSQISDLVEYVTSLSGREADEAAAARGAQTFAQTCATCHGPEGRGDPAQGAPNLTDHIWLYGGDKITLQETLYQGRGGVMPAWSDRLSEEQIAALAVYVHSLGGGE
ncbi:cytochrome-c oxidase, cbb3-type subunit III [Hyphococcus luteus]|uniref:Cbb3-type cytochrome c oxidase subunit n=1 Tax=Hyphococcus luteus TaxID=2058213 RepID=A0A2S7K8S0_9PROT|nr:cytochrome-c oxidase, cbb3-type subunit III [Marinicaulis flavus]PQA88881.1 cytochrome-c oxidase, cbb3-type subunit III [Marinicaulis flavus]